MRVLRIGTLGAVGIAIVGLGGGRAREDDRVTVDFVGKIDGVPFQGGSASDFNFVLGGGQMLPEFDTAATGLAPGAEKTFDLKFPDDYQGKEVAGKTAQFTITVKKVEEGKLPALDADFAISLGIMDGDIAKMREDVKGNLEREGKKRLQSRIKIEGARVRKGGPCGSVVGGLAEKEDDLRRAAENLPGQAGVSKLATCTQEAGGNSAAGAFWAARV